MHDFIFSRATIIDGTGAPAIRGDLAVDGGLIAAVGEDLGPARERIDAAGLILAPGIIDPHTHYDAQITWDPGASPSLGLGVTSIIMGNCGFTIAPCKPADRRQTLENLTQVEGMSFAALEAGTRWDFETFPQYLQMLENQGVAPNVAVYCGHSSLRTWVMGKEASERPASAGEIVEMRTLLLDALEAGAVGLASSTFEGHNGSGGVPMPSRLAHRDELAALVSALGEADKGCFMLTKGRNDEIAFFESLAEKTGRPMVIAAIAYDKANPDGAFADLAAIEAAAGRGHPVYAQVPCTPISMDLSLTGFYAFEALASWKPAIGLYHDKTQLAALYADPDFRARVKAELVAPGALNRFTDQWHLMEILEPALEEHRALAHRNVAELAEADGKHPLDWLLDFGARENFDTLFNAQILNADEEQVLKLLRSPRTSIALSDAGAHLSLFCDAGFALHMLSRWVRERGDFGLEEAVYRLTGMQADIYGISNRGRLAAGRAADLILFDADTIGRGPKQRVEDLPAGAARLVTGSTGLHGVWVNGVRVVEDDRLSLPTNLPGQVLREFAN